MHPGPYGTVDGIESFLSDLRSNCVYDLWTYCWNSCKRCQSDFKSITRYLAMRVGCKSAESVCGFRYERQCKSILFALAGHAHLKLIFTARLFIIQREGIRHQF